MGHLAGGSPPAKTNPDREGQTIWLYSNAPKVCQKCIQRSDRHPFHTLPHPCPSQDSVAPLSLSILLKKQATGTWKGLCSICFFQRTNYADFWWGRTSRPWGRKDQKSKKHCHAVLSESQRGCLEVDFASIWESPLPCGVLLMKQLGCTLLPPVPIGVGHGDGAMMASRERCAKKASH